MTFMLAVTAGSAARRLSQIASLGVRSSVWVSGVVAEEDAAAIVSASDHGLVSGHKSALRFILSFSGYSGFHLRGTPSTLGRVRVGSRG